MTEMHRRSPHEIEQDIRVIRTHIDETLDSLQRKLSPRELADQVFDFARENGSAFASNAGTMVANAGRAVRDNPVPVALLCLGAAWLMMGSRRAALSDRPMGRGADRRSSDVPAGGNGLRAAEEAAHGLVEEARSAGRELSGAGSAAQHRAEELAGHARAKVVAAGEAAADSISSAGGRLGDSARRAQEGMSQAARATGQYAQEHPLVVGAIMLAAGAAIAALLPRTRTEDSLLGGASAQVKESVGRAAENVVDKAGDAAAAAASAFKAEAKRNDMTPDRAKRAAGELAQAGSDAAKSALRAARDEIAQSGSEKEAARPGDEKGARTAEATRDSIGG